MEIKYCTIDSILVLELKGELKNKTVYKMKPFILKVVTEDCKKIILDMKEVQSVDISWCDYLVKMYKVMNNYGRELVITGCPASISNIDYTEKVRDLYPLYSSLEEAQMCFQPDFSRRSYQTLEQSIMP